MQTVIALGALLTLAQASPVPNAVEERGDTTYKCIISAMSGIDSTFTINAGGNAPSYSESVSSLLSIAMYGSDGSSKLMWNDGGKTNLLGEPDTQHLDAATTGLDDTVTWGGKNENGWQYCDCSYGSGANNHSTDFSQTSSTFFLTNSGTKTCSCGFDCAPNPAGYSTGWCGVHVTQYQKPDPSKDNYKFDIELKDAAGHSLANATGVDLPTGQTTGMTSPLPDVFELTAPATDNDAFWMHYGGQAFTTNDQAHSCNFGKFDSGKREGDCGFTC